MKNLYLIGGAMGTGKTTVSQVLKKTLPNSVFLDGDWCWDADPFQVTEETKNMVLENITCLLNNFIHCTAYDNIIFCWVMHEQAIIDAILSALDYEGCQIRSVSLICSRKALTWRLQKDVAKGLRSASVISKSLSYLPLYQYLDTVKIDVSDISPQQAADLIAALQPISETTTDF